LTKYGIGGKLKSKTLAREDGMAIYTRFGGHVLLTTRIDSEGFVLCAVKWDEDKGYTNPKEYHISDLRADDGINEIYDTSSRIVV
jgi:hypothetical protein